MIELRLCDIAAAKWLNKLRLRPGGERVTAPTEFGRMFHRAVLRKLEDYPTVGELTSSPVEGLVLALKGSVVFDSPHLGASVAHALAAGAVGDGGSLTEADEIENFLFGFKPYSAVPAVLAAAGVYSCLPRETALEFSRWIHSVKEKKGFAEEVDDMFGEEAVDVYSRVAASLEIVFDSVSIHESDLCCWRLPGTEDDVEVAPQIRLEQRPVIEDRKEIEQSVHRAIKEFSERGDQLAHSGKHQDAIKEYNQAWELIPEPKNEWEAATWVLAAIADCCFVLGKYKSGRQALEYAMTCPAGLGNPFLHLRLGQVLFEAGEFDPAADELMRAYMGAGNDIFGSDDPKYLAFLRTRAKI